MPQTGGPNNKIAVNFLLNHNNNKRKSRHNYKSIPLYLHCEIECQHHMHETCGKLYILHYSEPNKMHIFLPRKR